MSAADGDGHPIDIAALLARIDDLEARLGVVEAESDPDHDRRLCHVEADLGTVQSDVDEAKADITALEQRVDEWEG